MVLIVTDYRLNANHNYKTVISPNTNIVTDYRLNANHNDNIRTQANTVDCN
ncbi:Helicase loader DnaI [uncultured Gammaproteobacteria bacterium]|nr:Helicase loader DnaI [uncultured Gammaproteobacteria bacterium]